MDKPDHHPKHHAPMARPPLKTVYWSVLSASFGIWALAELQGELLATFGGMMMIGAFGASAVLLYAAPNSPLAQPYNVMVGHVLSALIGVTVFQVVGEANSTSMALAVALSIGAMQLTRSVHPPGGATALIAVIGAEPIHRLGYDYALSPVAMGAAVLVAVALVTNNVSRKSRWPLFWMPYAMPAIAFWKRQPQER